MNKFVSLLAVTLLLASSLAWAEADKSADLRYCLDLKSAYEIAQCAGEVSPTRKGKPYSKKKVEEILSREKTSAPVSPEKPSAAPATPSEESSENVPPEEPETESK